MTSTTNRPRTFGELRNSPWADPPLRGRRVRDEIRTNLLRRLERNEELFPGIVGYEDTIVPQLVNALLARHHFILLGLRGQAKSRILRQLADLLDEWMPMVAGSEVNDDPFAPISKFARERLAECGDATAIGWVHRSGRYVEKLATPDVTIADIIGDVDPIKAARGGHLLSDELTMHFGLLPRANRGIFTINELPDLSGKVQVGLFNIMQEGDVQIKGYPVRLPLDVLLAFTANPEDYTARGKIITPLKDRIGSEIVTHYPRTVQLGMEITTQEAWTARGGLPIDVPEFVLELVERVAFEAREDKRVDKRSGVSQRLPISVLESVVSNAERRAVAHGARRIVPRISDVYTAVPSITGKLELEYEGELQGADTIARELIRRAAGRVMDERLGGADLSRIVAWFDQGGALKVSGDERAEVCLKGFAAVPGLLETVSDTGLAPRSDVERAVAACELVLEGLAAHKRISRNEELGYTRAKPERREPGSGGYGKGIAFG
ncbi:MAG TPA: magnesium chelatase [Gemmatimonadales bacterium]|nr:magnesium chelatase [Gemmatimonadales bacterium]